jgi:hypothetical protein
MIATWRDVFRPQIPVLTRMPLCRHIWEEHSEVVVGCRMAGHGHVAGAETSSMINIILVYDQLSAGLNPRPGGVRLRLCLEVWMWSWIMALR